MSFSMDHNDLDLKDFNPNDYGLNDFNSDDYDLNNFNLNDYGLDSFDESHMLTPSESPMPSNFDQNNFGQSPMFPPPKASATGVLNQSPGQTQENEYKSKMLDLEKKLNDAQAMVKSQAVKLAEKQQQVQSGARLADSHTGEGVPSTGQLMPFNIIMLRDVQRIRRKVAEMIQTQLIHEYVGR
jgi:hypothetical protein